MEGQGSAGARDVTAIDYSNVVKINYATVE